MLFSGRPATGNKRHVGTKPQAKSGSHATEIRPIALFDLFEHFGVCDQRQDRGPAGFDSSMLYFTWVRERALLFAARRCRLAWVGFAASWTSGA
jgi:hypothetical protein